jgi:hypothetical protein
MVVANIPMVTETERYIEAAQDTYDLLKQVIAEIPELRSLTSARIKLLFDKKGKKIKGRSVLGTAKAFGKDEVLYHDFQFQITLDMSYWEESPENHKALLAHELGHCGFTDDEDPTLIPHDLEEFHFVVKHFGLWRSDVARFAESLEESEMH